METISASQLEKTNPALYASVKEIGDKAYPEFRDTILQCLGSSNKVALDDTFVRLIGDSDGLIYYVSILYAYKLVDGKLVGAFLSVTLFDDEASYQQARQERIKTSIEKFGSAKGVMEFNGKEL